MMAWTLIVMAAAQAQAPARAPESDFAREVYENVRRDIPAVDEASVLLPVDLRHLPPRSTTDWLAGYWVVSKGECLGGDFGVSYGADGRFSDHWFSGRYEIVGGRLSQVVEELTDAAEPGDRVGARFTRELRLIGPNEIVLGQGSDEERLFRCPEGGMPAR